jgi:hypothetical protein
MEKLLNEKARILKTGKTGKIQSIGNYKTPNRLILVLMNRKKKTLVYGRGKVEIVNPKN